MREKCAELGIDVQLPAGLLTNLGSVRASPFPMTAHLVSRR